MKVVLIVLFAQVIVVTRSITVPPVQVPVRYVHHASQENAPLSYQGIHVDRSNEEFSSPPTTAVKKITTLNNRPVELEEPVSPHETPRDVPTRPVYPGPGQWAKYGVQHRPYVHQPQYVHAQEADHNENPEGYDVFEQGEEQFKKANQKFRQDVDNYPSRYQISDSEEDVSTENLDDKPKIGFIPQKLYAQVRRTENEEHLPRSEIDPTEEDATRLREVIKDSKIHTVYTEEGYEDSAYDHAGHEKNAENSESNSQLDEHVKSSSKNKKPKRGKQKAQRYKVQPKDSRKKKLKNRDRYEEQEDEIDSASSEYQVRKINPTPTTNSQKVMLKNGKKIDLEIHTEVKYVPESNKKRHKYVKIIPTQNTSLKRTKRYDKDLLSKRYIRKRPNYYWKKNKSTDKNNLHGRNMRYNNSPVQALDKITASPVLMSTATPSLTTVRPQTYTESPTYETTTKNPTRIPFRPKTRPAQVKKVPLKRQKRYTIDHPEIDVDFDKFVQLENIPITTPKPDLTYVKYPYYKLPTTTLNSNSPLRYAEDLNQVPIKRPGEMSFYESRAHINCPEIETDVNPIPERIAKQEEEDNEDDEVEHEVEDVEMPRLKYLGDKIDCLKVKYFGENPLDSPFFKEESVNEPIPLLLTNLVKYSTQKNNGKYQKKENKIDSKINIKRNTDTKTNNQSKSNLNINSKIKRGNRYNNETPVTSKNRVNTMKNSKKRELKIEILEPIVVIDDELFETVTTNSIKEKMKSSSEPPLTVLEISNTNKEAVIKSAPKSIYDQLVLLDEEDETNKDKSKPISEPEKFVIIYENVDPGTNKNVSPENKLVKTKPSKPTTTTTATTITTTTTTVTTTTTAATTTTIASTEKSTNIPKFRDSSENTQKINKPLPKLQNKKVNLQRPTETVIPGTTVNSPLNISSSLPPRTPFVRQPISPFTYVFDISRYLPRITTHAIISTATKYKRDVNAVKQNFDTPSSPRQDLTSIVKIIHKVLNKRSTDINENKPSNLNNQSKRKLIKRDVNEGFSKRVEYLNEDNSDLLMDGTKLFEQYVPYTLQYSKSKRNADDEDLMPAESKQFPTYMSSVRKPKVYTEIVRARPVNREPPENIEEEEDLNPRKRIYELKTLDQINSEKTVETIEVAEEDSFETTSTPTTTAEPIIYPVEANSDHSNIAQYVFIIEKLHEKRLRENPPTTEAEDSSGTDQPDTNTLATQISSERVKIPEGGPAYLQIINHLHNVRHEVAENSSSVHDEETSSTNEQVKQQSASRNLNPFSLDSITPDSFMSELSYMQAKLDPASTKSEINESAPSSRTRNFNNKFKTSVDTSKYKSIDRGSVNMRHNFSSRYNSADQELPLNKSLTTQKPVLFETTTKLLDTVSETVPDALQSVADETVQTVKPKTVQTTATRLRQRTRTRSRPTTLTSTSTTVQPVDAVTTNPAFRRRRPNRVTTTSTETPTTPKTTSIAHRGRSRLHLQTRADTQPTTTESQPNAKLISTELPEDATKVSSTVPSENKKRRTLQKVHERRVMSEVTLTRYYEPASDESLPNDSVEDTKNAQESKKHQYEVIGPLTHVDTRHGGNYKYEKNATTSPPSKNNKENKVSTLSDPETFYKDPHLAININQLKEEPKLNVHKNKTTNSVYTRKDVSKQITNEYSLVEQEPYPNMAHMVNRLASVDVDAEATTLLTEEDIELEETVTASSTQHKPNIIKDPSRRMYFYANV